MNILRIKIIHHLAHFVVKPGSVHPHARHGTAYGVVWWPQKHTAAASTVLAAAVASATAATRLRTAAAATSRGGEPPGECRRQRVPPRRGRVQVWRAI